MIFLREINCLFTNFLLPQIEGPRKESRSFGACQTQRRNSTHQGCNGQGWRRRSYHMERQGRGANQKRHYRTWRKCQNQVIFCFNEFFLIHMYKNDILISRIIFLSFLIRDRLVRMKEDKNAFMEKLLKERKAEFDKVIIWKRFYFPFSEILI